MNIVITICLVLVGLINFAPIAGVFSADNLSRAYSVTLASNDLVVLMRHRALLFGIIGGFILYSAFAPKYQSAAMLMAFISMTGFLALIFLEGNVNASISKIMWIDVVGLVLLAIAAYLKYFGTQAA